VQAVAEVHDTRANSLPSGQSSGVGSIAHVVPFQASVSVTAVAELFPESPTAVHELAEVHDTPDRVP
jgi:hypothetical protein